MDESSIYETYTCSDYIYSGDYINLLIKYDGDLQRVYERINPACVTIINNQFLIAYKRNSDDIRRVPFGYGYNSVPKCYGLMDTTAVVETGADRVRALPGLGLTGNDTLIGFIDTGIDYTNPLFRMPDGSTRIEAIWDQTEEVVGTGRRVFGYGAEYTKPDIDSALRSDNPFSVVPTVDDIGHGTFLASVAAGNVDVKSDFIGMAPGCKIVVVKLKQVKDILRKFYLINESAPCYGEDDILLGVKYLITKAIMLRRPMIICFGLGTNQGDHAGNNILELYLETIMGLRGICVITPGGNELGFGNHYSGNNRSDSSSYQDSMEINVGENDSGFTMEIWGSAPSLLRISILSPTGELFDKVSPIRDGVTHASFIYEGTEVYIENVVVESISGDQLVFLKFINPSQGIWTIIVDESSSFVGRGFNSWLPIHSFHNSDTHFVRPDPDITICSPGNGRGAITVAGYNHITKALYVHSSRGYTRKDVIKPEITAPSVNVYGAFAKTTPSASDSQPLFTTMDGTSVGAAFVAGAASMIMEWAYVKGNNPAINTESIKQMLIRGAGHVANVVYPNRSWGWGILDVYGTFEAMRNL